MEFSKLFIERLRDSSINEFGVYVNSNSTPEKKYFVAKRKGKWECDCVAGMMRKECKHIKRVAKERNESEKCFYCGTTKYAVGTLDGHHIYRRSTNPELKNFSDTPENEMKLCRTCHDRATNDLEFEKQLQNIWEMRIKEQSVLRQQ